MVKEALYFSKCEVWPWEIKHSWAVKSLWITWYFYRSAVLYEEELSDEVNIVALTVVNTSLREFMLFNVFPYPTLLHVVGCLNRKNFWMMSRSVETLQSPEISVSWFVFWEQLCYVVIVSKVYHHTSAVITGFLQYCKQSGKIKVSSGPCWSYGYRYCFLCCDVKAS